MLQRKQLASMHRPPGLESCTLAIQPSRAPILSKSINQSTQQQNADQYNTFLRCSARSSFCLISASVNTFFFFFLRSSLASLGGGFATVWPVSSDITSKLTENAPRPIGRCIRPSSCRVANNCFSSTRSTGLLAAPAGSGRAVHKQTVSNVVILLLLRPPSPLLGRPTIVWTSYVYRCSF